jgi:hypothetical protein
MNNILKALKFNSVLSVHALMVFEIFRALVGEKVFASFYVTYECFSNPLPGENLPITEKQDGNRPIAEEQYL